jgi:eukaryotic-like serine/threonine-protein kinase
MTPSLAIRDGKPAPYPDIELDEFIAAFESAIAADPAAFLPPANHPLYIPVQCELVRVDLEIAWGRGDERRVEDYRSRFPALFAHPVSLQAVVREEMRLRAAAGEKPDESELIERFGSEWSSGHLVPKSVHPAIVEPSKLPEPGDTVEGFELTSELGRGAFGRVYLAKQVDLAGRLVALKVSAKFPGEWRTLARLRHANIVPVYSVHRHGRFHLACMPYLGGTTLADLICDQQKNGGEPGSGRTIASTLQNHAARTAVSNPGRDSTETISPLPSVELPPAIREQYERASYPEWVLWLGAELADGLAHAHERGILHRDLKPANVLLADDGRPTLLDFNLSNDVAEDGEYANFVGGTLRYMAPEHLAALADSKIQPDTRADLYSLGLILFELMTGRLPDDDSQGNRTGTAASLHAIRSAPPPDVRTYRPDLTPAIASILRTVLTPDAALRYQSAGDLRDDLRRQLNHEPLKFAPDRSPRERFRKWRHRHAQLTSWATVSLLTAFLLAGVVTTFIARQQHFQSVAATNHLYQLGEVRSEVRATIVTPTGPKSEYLEAIAKCQSVLSLSPSHTDRAWANHDLIRPLSTEQRKRAYELFTELHLLKLRAELYAGGTVNKADLETAVREANRLEGQISLKSTRITRATVQQTLPSLRTAARTESGRWEYWQQLGHCERIAGDTIAAQSQFKLAGMLNPDSPWPHYHLGTAALEARDWKMAVSAFDRCIELREEIREAYLNRAIAKIESNDLVGAIADLNRIEPDAERLPRLYFVRSVAKRRNGDAKGAEADRIAGIKLEPTDAAGWNARGEAKLSAA